MKKVTTDEIINKGFVESNGKWSYKGKPCVLDFYADWCSPCKPQETILTELSKENVEIDFYKINVEEEPDLAELFNIKNLPTIILCSKEQKKITGFTQKRKLEELLNKVEVTV